MQLGNFVFELSIYRDVAVQKDCSMIEELVANNFFFKRFRVKNRTSSCFYLASIATSLTWHCVQPEIQFGQPESQFLQPTQASARVEHDTGVARAQGRWTGHQLRLVVGRRYYFPHGISYCTEVEQ